MPSDKSDDVLVVSGGDRPDRTFVAVDALLSDGAVNAAGYAEGNKGVIGERGGRNAIARAIEHVTTGNQPPKENR